MIFLHCSSLDSLYFVILHLNSGLKKCFCTKNSLITQQTFTPELLICIKFMWEITSDVTRVGSKLSSVFLFSTCNWILEQFLNCHLHVVWGSGLRCSQPTLWSIYSCREGHGSKGWCDSGLWNEWRTSFKRSWISGSGNSSRNSWGP